MDPQLTRSSWWTTSSADRPDAAITEHKAIAVRWSPHTALARTSRPVTWNFNAASLASPAAATAAAARGGPSTPAAGCPAGRLLAAPTVSHGQGGGGGTTAASTSGSAGGPVLDHAIAERRRREKINQRFIELSALIPGLKKVDKATILLNAVKYVKEMEDMVKKLEDGAATTVRSAVLADKKTKARLGHSGDTSAHGLPEIEVRMADEKSVLVRIQCENARGILARVLAEVEALRLAITQASVMPFATATAIITVTAKVEAGFNMTVEQIVRRLNSTLNQHYSDNSDQNAAKREY